MDLGIFKSLYDFLAFFLKSVRDIFKVIYSSINFFQIVEIAMGRKLQLLSFASANAAIVLLVGAVVTKSWATRENSKLHVYEGLFEKCILYKLKNNERCMEKYEGDVPPGKISRKIIG